MPKSTMVNGRIMVQDYGLAVPAYIAEKDEFR